MNLSYGCGIEFNDCMVAVLVHRGNLEAVRHDVGMEVATFESSIKK